MDDWQTE